MPEQLPHSASGSALVCAAKEVSATLAMFEKQWHGKVGEVESGPITDHLKPRVERGIISQALHRDGAHVLFGRRGEWQSTGN
jgi:hypothetical protein